MMSAEKYSSYSASYGQHVKADTSRDRVPLFGCHGASATTMLGGLGMIASLV